MRKTATIHLHIDRAVGEDKALDTIMDLEMEKMMWQRNEKPASATMTNFILEMVKRGVASTKED